MRELKNCIVCNSDKLSTLLDFGEMYPCVFLDNLEEQKLFTKSPFVVNICKCGMVQLKYIEEYDNLFKKYWYRSSINNSMIESLKDIVNCRQINSLIKGLEIHYLEWLDIANNDGVLSKIIKESYDNTFVVGVDPALDLNNTHNDVFINDYFSRESLDKEIGNRKFDIITNIAQFYDLVSPGQFLDDVYKSLQDWGIYIIQMTDLHGCIKSNAIDNFCQEHVAYYPLYVISNLLKKHGLQIYDLDYNKTNGASVRLFICKTGTYTPEPIVNYMIDYQKEDCSKQNIQKWYKKVNRQLSKFKKYLEKEKNKGKKISLIGASTKGHTVLSLCNIDSNLIDNALELSDFKFNKYCIGSEIKIVDEKEYKDADILVAMIWHYKESILKNFSNRKIVFPLPNFEIYK